jgi:hypothetical protein
MPAGSAGNPSRCPGSAGLHKIKIDGVLYCVSTEFYIKWKNIPHAETESPTETFAKDMLSKETAKAAGQGLAHGIKGIGQFGYGTLTWGLLPTPGFLQPSSDPIMRGSEAMGQLAGLSLSLAIGGVRGGVRPGQNLEEIMRGSEYIPTQGNVYGGTINKIAKSFLSEGYNPSLSKPWNKIIVDSSGNIVHGHHRLIAEQIARKINPNFRISENEIIILKGITKRSPRSWSEVFVKLGEKPGRG